MAGRIGLVVFVALMTLLLVYLGVTYFPQVWGPSAGPHLDMFFYAGLCLTGPALLYVAYGVSLIRQRRQTQAMEISFHPMICAGCGQKIDTPQPTRQAVYTAHIRSITSRHVGGFMSNTYRKTTIWDEFKKHDLAVCPVCERNARFDRIIKVEMLICLGLLAVAALYLFTISSKVGGPFLFSAAAVLALPVAYLQWWKLEARLKRYAVINRQFGDVRVREYAEAKNRPVWKTIRHETERNRVKPPDGTRLELPRFQAFTPEEYERIRKRNILSPQ